MRGLELADSVTMDPHKWLYQAYECGCLLVRDGSALRQAFEIAPDYLLDVVPGEEEVNFSDLGLQLSRTSHAFKVWLSVHAFGLAAFRDAIDTSLDLTAHAQRLVEAERHARPRLPRVARDALLPAPLRRGPGRVRVGRDARGAAGRARGERRRLRVVHAPAWPLRHATLRDEPHHRSRRRGARAGVPLRASRSPGRSGASGNRATAFPT